MDNRKALFKLILVLLAVIPTAMIPVVITWVISPTFLFPFPFVWSVVAFLYIKKYGFEKGDGKLLLLIPFVLLMFVFSWLGIAIRLWANR